MFCKNCGETIKNEEKFCGKCGAGILTDNVNKDHQVKSKSFQLGKGVAEEGLGGWLIIVCIGLLYSLVTALMTVYSNGKMFLDGTVESLSEISGYATALGFEFFAYAILALSIIYLLFLFFKKRKTFPKYYIYFVIAIVAISIVDIGIFSSLNYPTEEVKQIVQGIINESYTAFGKTCVYAIVWGLYMKRSERVKLTFVE